MNRTRIPIWYFTQDNYFILGKKALEIKSLSCLTKKINLRVRIWLSTFKGQLRSKICLLFKSQYYKFLFDIWLQSFMGFTCTFDLQKSSGVQKNIPFESPYMTSYLTSMDNISLSRTVFEIFDFNVHRVWPWPLTPEGHLGSKKIIQFENPYMTSYLTPIDNISLFPTVFEIFDFKVFRVWPWPLTPKGHLGSQNFIPFESPYMTSYLTSMDNISLPRTVFEIFDFKVVGVWPWPLTPKSHLGSKKIIPFESPYMTSYLTPMDNISLSRTVFEILDFKVFRVWPWPLTPRGHLGSKKIIPFESPSMTSYLTPMDNISLSPTVFEIFDFEVFRVWPWPLTPEDHLGSKIIIPFERPYTTSYLTPMDNISLSRTVFEIFDLKVFRVWPWPLTPKDHLGSKIIIPFESPYMTSYLTPMDNISLSRTVFEIFDFKVFRVWPWPATPKGHLGSKKLYCSKAHIWLPIWLLWTTSLYFVPF